MQEKVPHQRPLCLYYAARANLSCSSALVPKEFVSPRSSCDRIVPQDLFNEGDKEMWPNHQTERRAGWTSLRSGSSASFQTADTRKGWDTRWQSTTSLRRAKD